MKKVNGKTFLKFINRVLELRREREAIEMEKRTWIKNYAKEMTKLSIQYAKKTGYILLPGPFFSVIPVPIKWFPKLEELIKEER